MDPTLVPDPLLWFDAALGAYVPFGVEEFRSIVEGRAKL
jgi:hypothetical protein